MANQALPGNPRYQPKDLVEVFGYDNLARTLVQVEVAALKTLAKAGVISAEDIARLTPEIEEKLLAITTTEMDKVEREITKHDIRALVRLMQDVVPAPLRRWVHVPLTSYDVIDTARALQFLHAHQNIVRPKVVAVMTCMSEQAFKYADHVQIGRTHGQHALPVTVGFWYATILNRMLFNLREMDRYAAGLSGKISGAVGACNAQVALGINEHVSFEKELLELLGLHPAPISTQILPPEPLAYYLYASTIMSASLAQFGRDARHLMRTEIGELAEPFESGQVGSSTMAHKRNPLNFENLEGTWIKTKNEFGNVFDTLISEHQRDLVGSAPARDFPTILVNLVQQLDTLLRPGKDGTPFIGRLVVDTDACLRNLNKQGDYILAEPIYLALQMYGYEGDAHELVNHTVLPRATKEGWSLTETIESLSLRDTTLAEAWARIPTPIRELFEKPHTYTGDASRRAHEVCREADTYMLR